MKRLVLPLLLASAALAAPLALAQKGPGPGGPGFGPPGGPFGIIRFDANGDGKVSRAELDNGQKAAFAELDADKNGSVTHEEMRASMQARRETAEKARFDRMDADKNGQLSKAELEAGRPDGDHKKGPGRRDDRGPGPKGPGRGADAGPMTFDTFATRGVAMFERLDVDRNGTVTVKEMQSAADPA